MSTLSQTQEVQPGATPPNSQVPLVPSNWGPGTPNINDPLVFNRFDPSLGTLSSITVSFNPTIANSFTVTVPNNSPLTTVTLSTGPSVTGDTGGPLVDVKGPDGTTDLFSPLLLQQPVAVRTVSGGPGVYSSTASGSNFIPPVITSPTFTENLLPSNPVFSQFIGTGTVSLPVTATASSSVLVNSGNGTGLVTTSADAILTLQYHYTPNTVPEPSSIALLVVGAGAFALLHRARLRSRSSRIGSEPPPRD
jgi:hypothetical protein